jgi:dTDP-glucose 4,6-dehydratase
MNVLITGAAGFIGANLLYLLAEKRPNWKLTALDLLTYAGNLQTIEPLVNDGRVQFERINIVDGPKVGNLFHSSHFDLVFHLAAESHVDRSIHSASEFVLTNVVGTQNLLGAAMATGVKKFVHISTDEVYGSLGNTGRFVETTPLDPTSPYAASKAASDLMALSCWKTHGFQVSVTRCTNNYGPYQFPEKFIPLFVTNAIDQKPLPLYGDGLNVRSWIHVRDHVEGLLSVAESGKPGEVYNIGGFAEAELPNKEVAKMILRQLGRPESLIQFVADRPAHDRRYAVDATKIREATGWEPKISLEEGFHSTVEWYEKNRAWWERIKTGEYLKFYEKNYSNR